MHKFHSSNEKKKRKINNSMNFSYLRREYREAKKVNSR